jgi:hypothetical protein
LSSQFWTFFPCVADAKFQEWLDCQTTIFGLSTTGFASRREVWVSEGLGYAEQWILTRIQWTASGPAQRRPSHVIVGVISNLNDIPCVLLNSCSLQHIFVRWSQRLTRCICGVGGVRFE